MSENMKEFLAELNKSEFVRKMIPVGLGMGLPMLNIIDDDVVVSVPYYKVAPNNNKILIYPPEFKISAIYESGQVTSYENLHYSDDLKDVNFEKSIGIFKHEAINTWNKKMYHEKKDELYSMYDELIESLYSDESFKSEKDFKKLINIIIEPSLKPYYERFGGDFFKYYLE